MSETDWQRFARQQPEAVLTNEAPADTEFFIRRAFKTDPQKGCELLFRQYYRPLCTYAVRFVYAIEVAEDLVADVFYTFWNTKAYQQVNQSFRGYLFRSVRNRAYNYLANELKPNYPIELAGQSEMPPADGPELMIRFDELAHRVDELVAALPPQCRKIFIQNRFEGRRAKDIAQELQLSVRTVEVHIAKALSTLRNGLRDHWLLWVLWLSGQADTLLSLATT